MLYGVKPGEIYGNLLPGEGVGGGGKSNIKKMGGFSLGQIFLPVFHQNIYLFSDPWLCGLSQQGGTQLAKCVGTFACFLSGNPKTSRYGSGGGSGSVGVSKDVQKSQGRFLDQIQGALKRFRGFGGKSDDQVGPEHHVGTVSPQAFDLIQDKRAVITTSHAFQDGVIA